MSLFLCSCSSSRICRDPPALPSDTRNEAKGYFSHSTHGLEVLTPEAGPSARCCLAGPRLPGAPPPTGAPAPLGGPTGTSCRLRRAAQRESGRATSGAACSPAGSALGSDPLHKRPFLIILACPAWDPFSSTPSLSAQVVVTQTLICPQSGDWESEFKVSAGVLSPEASPSTYRSPLLTVPPHGPPSEALCVLRSLLD